MPRNAQSPRKKLPAKTPKEIESCEKVNCLPAFVLGAAFAFILSAASVFSSIYWICKEVPVSPALQCPQIITKNENKKRGILGAIRQKSPAYQDMELELAAQDPKDCACRFALSFFTGSNPEVSAPLVCTPTEKQTVQRRPSAETMERYKSAYTPERFEVALAHSQLIVALGERMRQVVPDWEERSKNARWGGSAWDWYGPKQKATSDSTDLEELDGGSLFYSYLKIMKWPHSLTSHFPFKLCSKGCDSTVAVAHTLEFREKYQPWMYSPSVKQENEKGYSFFHGFSASREEIENASHAVVWIRPGLRTKVDDTAQTRVYLNSLERAVAASLIRSNGRVGKFNVVLDGSGFSIGLTPSLHHVKVFVTMLQDHYPDRLGMILLANLGRVGEVVVKMFLPIISEEVRNKIVVLPKDPAERQEILNAVVGYENSPTWLGGVDTYQFQSEEYYADEQFLFSDEEAKAYIETMPYHA